MTSILKDIPAFFPIADKVPALICIYNIKTGHYSYVNLALETLLGYSPQVFLSGGLPFVATLVHPDDLPEIMAKNEAALLSDKKSPEKSVPIINFEYRMKHKNGNWVWLHTDGSVHSRDKQGNIETVLNVSVDITERKKKEINTLQELVKSNERYQALVAQSSEGMWLFEVKKPVSIHLPAREQINWWLKSAYLVECNDVLARMYGFSQADDIIGAQLSDFFVPDDPENIEYLEAFIRSSYRITGAESHERDKDGNDRYFENSLIGIVKDERLLRAWGSQVDITERKQTELQKNDFISITSHELKTPITSLVMYSHLLSKKNIFNSKKAPELIKKMSIQIHRLAGLVVNLLDATKIQEQQLPLHKEKMSLLKLCKDIVADFQLRNGGHTFIIEGTYNRSVLADKFQINQVLVNLIGNAVKFSPKKEKIVVQVSSTSKTVSVKVKDFGIGISKADQKKLFIRFYQAESSNNKEGLGLGLFISANIMAAHGGNLTVESEKGKGSTFTLTLPKKEKTKYTSNQDAKNNQRKPD